MTRECEHTADLQPQVGAPVGEGGDGPGGHTGPAQPAIDFDHDHDPTGEWRQTAQGGGRIGPYAHPGPIAEGPQARDEVVARPQRVSDENVCDLSGASGEDLGLPDGGDADAPGSQSDLPASDLRAFVGLGVRSQRHAGPVGEGGHALKVALEPLGQHHGRGSRQARRQ